MSGKSSRTSKVAAWILIISNFIVMICCVLLFAFSLWTISSPSSLSTAIRAIGSPVLTAISPPQVFTVEFGVGTAVLAIFIFFISFMGFYGAITRSQFLLFMYAILIILLLMLEFALMYYYSSNFMEKGFQKDDDDQFTHILRLSFNCCEYNITDLGEVPKMPWSCCGTAGYPDNCTTTGLFHKDCFTTIANWLNRYQIAIYASLAVLHIILSSCSLLRKSRSVSRLHS